MAANPTRRFTTGLRRFLLPLLAVTSLLLATSACYYGPYGYYGYGYPGYAYAPPVAGGVVVGAYPRRYYWR